MDKTEEIKLEMNKYANPEKADFLLKFFKAAPGGYGDGDQFIGVKVPIQRKIAKKHYKSITLEELQLLLRDPVHEYRLTSLIILVSKFEKVKLEPDRKRIVDFYINNISFVNNWDLVDSSADKILGAYLFGKNKDILYEYAVSNNLWKQRIAIISTYYFIRKSEFEDTLNIASMLLGHKHDLIHKAVGWMLREVGNRDFKVELKFLNDNYKTMPRTMLRYAIEKFEPELRSKFLKGLV